MVTALKIKELYWEVFRERMFYREQTCVDVRFGPVNTPPTIPRKRTLIQKKLEEH